MNTDRMETAPPAEEFPSPAAEFTSPGPEFTPVAKAEAAPPDRRRKRRFLLYAAAALAVLWLLLGRTSGEAFAPGVSPAKPARGEAASGPAETSKQDPPPAAQSARPTPTPAPTPVPTPSFETIFLCFSKDYTGLLTLQHPEAIESVTAEYWESGLEESLMLYELTREEIDSGRCLLPPLDAGKVYESHSAYYFETLSEPAVELRVSMLTVDGECVSQTVPSSYELGWSFQLITEDLAMFYPFIDVPAPFLAFATYETPTEPVLTLNDPAAAERGVISVSLSINGRPYDGDFSVYANAWDVYRYDESGNPVPSGELWYNGYLVIPIGGDVPAHGTLHYVVTQPLSGYDAVWTTEGDFEY